MTSLAEHTLITQMLEALLHAQQKAYMNIDDMPKIDAAISTAHGIGEAL